MSAAPQLAPRVRELLVKLLWLTDSPNPHEREVAREKFFALLTEHRLTPADVLVPPPVNTVVQIVHPSAPVYQPPPSPRPPPPRPLRVWRDVVEDILRSHQGALFEKERMFLPDLLRKGFAPRGGQVDWLLKIVKRTGVLPWDLAP